MSNCVSLGEIVETIEDCSRSLDLLGDGSFKGLSIASESKLSQLSLALWVCDFGVVGREKFRFVGSSACLEIL